VHEVYFRQWGVLDVIFLQLNKHYHKHLKDCGYVLHLGFHILWEEKLYFWSL